MPATSPETRLPLRRALISVYDKTGLIELATALHEAEIELVSTGSTAARIAKAGIPVTPVEEVTGFPECLDGRVKTLHPMIHAGILADRRQPSHREQLAELGINAFDLVVGNLYPFSQTVAAGADPEECIEQIDIGGPAMLRAAAKNHASLAVVVSPTAYASVVQAVASGGFTLDERRHLAVAAFRHTASYDVDVATWMGQSLAAETAEPGEGDGVPLPSWTGATWERAAVLRYGENPHQRAALYRDDSGADGLAQATQLHGKAMSYNNYVDADAAWRAAHDHGESAVAIIKHANPCGIAVGADIAQAHARAHACDPVSAFGGVIAANETVTEAMARQVADVFTEVVVAPAFEDAALEVLTRKKNIRLLQVAGPPTATVEMRQISGGLLVQSADRIDAVVDSGGDRPLSWQLVCGEPADAATLTDLSFAWQAVRAARSNAILLARDGAAVGVGMGQVNRVDSCRLAVERANTLGQASPGADDGAAGTPPERARGAVAASDAFFPFADGLQVLIDAGVRAVVQPGGSVRDEEVIAAAQAAGITMYLTGTRHFAH